jgi:hypothetical protein
MLLYLCVWTLIHGGSMKRSLKSAKRNRDLRRRRPTDEDLESEQLNFMDEVMPLSHTDESLEAKDGNEGSQSLVDSATTQ